MNDIDTLIAQKDAAYHERNQLVALLAALYPSSLERHPDSDATWEDDWRWIVFIDTPAGQMSWHIHDSELPLFRHVPDGKGVVWDGHTTEEKYARVRALIAAKMTEKYVQSAAEHYVGQPVSDEMMDEMAQNLAQRLQSSEDIDGARLIRWAWKTKQRMALERIANVMKTMWHNPEIHTNDLPAMLGDSVECPRCYRSSFTVHNVTRTRVQNAPMIFTTEMNVGCGDCGHQWVIRWPEAEEEG